jgi:hypothetical protein
VDFIGIGVAGIAPPDPEHQGAHANAPPNVRLLIRGSTRPELTDRIEERSRIELSDQRRRALEANIISVLQRKHLKPWSLE